MQINTKYDIGQTIHFPYCNDSFSNWRVMSISVDKVKTRSDADDTDIYYGYTAIDWRLMWVKEDNIYTTRELALSECDRRNNEKGARDK